LGKAFADMIRQRDDFELFVEPDSNIVCFRYLKNDMDDEQLNKLNSNLRKAILEKGDFYIVQTQLNKNTWFRITLMSPHTTASTLEELLDYIKKLAN
jgi:L-2,4-diaminobutyrate decarboxylase